jgi:hypothetical protein
MYPWSSVVTNSLDRPNLPRFISSPAKDAANVGRTRDRHWIRTAQNDSSAIPGPGERPQFNWERSNGYDLIEYSLEI